MLHVAIFPYWFAFSSKHTGGRSIALLEGLGLVIPRGLRVRRATASARSDSACLALARRSLGTSSASTRDGCSRWPRLLVASFGLLPASAKRWRSARMEGASPQGAGRDERWRKRAAETFRCGSNQLLDRSSSSPFSSSRRYPLRQHYPRNWRSRAATGKKPESTLGKRGRGRRSAERRRKPAKLGLRQPSKRPRQLARIPFRQGFHREVNTAMKMPTPRPR